MNEIIKIISIILFIVLLTYGFFSFIKKISNNYKVLLLPIITLLNSVFFGYKAFKTSDDIILIIWMSIFFLSILIIVSVLNRVYKINHRNHKPLENIINKTNINHNHHTNIEIVENSIQTNNQDIFSFKNLNESEIIELFDSNINNIYEDSKDDFLQLLKGVIPENKIIWKGTSGKGKTNITYTGIFILLNKILNLPKTKLEREDRKKLIEFIIKTFKKYNPDSENNCNEIAYSTLNTAYTNFSL